MKEEKSIQLVKSKESVNSQLYGRKPSTQGQRHMLGRGAGHVLTAVAVRYSDPAAFFSDFLRHSFSQEGATQPPLST
jgi:hypothetical protein